MQRTRPTLRTAGFTLVELMVVIGLITLLMGILVVAMGRAGTRAREEATRALIRKVSNQVQERLEALDRLRSRQQFKDQADSFFSASNISPEVRYNSFNVSVLPLNDTTKPILWHKVLIKYYFPQSFAELRVVERDLVYYPISAQYGQQYPALIANFNASNHQTETESSELLYFALTHMQVLGIPTVDPGEYKASEVQDTDNDGLLEFVDAWGKPLRFYRWPTRLYTTNTYDPQVGRPVIDRNLGATILQSTLPRSAAPDPLARDQDDPTYVLWPSVPPSVTFREEFEKSFHTTSTYHNFMIVSSGPDGRVSSGNEAFGLWRPTDQYLDGATVTRDISTNFGFLAAPFPGGLNAMSDNIVLRQ